MSRIRGSLMLSMALIVAVFLAAFIAWAAPPSGRPPIGPLERIEPEKYEVRFGVTLSTLQQLQAREEGIVPGAKRIYDLVEAPIVYPIVFMGAYSRVFNDSVGAKLWLNNHDTPPNLELKSGFPHGSHLATMTVRKFYGQNIRFQFTVTMQSWSSRLDDAWAAKIAWPKEWPEEVKDGLGAQTYIEAGDPIFKELVEKVTKNRLRLVPPFLAAKELVRHVINTVQTTGNGQDRGEFNVLRGMVVDGARFALTEKACSPHDLVCACVAVLRAAEIPARPVVGFQEDRDGKARYVSWCEFYLPEAGWVPFDPNEMRGKGIRTMAIDKPWPEFGTMKELNERVPVAYHFIPPATIESPVRPGIWGWDPRPGRDPGTDPQVNIEITGRGKGEEDPK